VCPVSYEWDFGDGTRGTGITTTHNYTNPGMYTARLTAQDAAGNTATSNTIITVQAYTVSTVPEFPFAILLPLFLIMTLITSIIYKRRRLKAKQQQSDTDLP
jgi:hypothetical protein